MELERRSGITKRRKKVLESLKDPRNWTPKLSKIARNIKLPVSTVHDVLNRLKNGEFDIKARLIVEYPVYEKKYKSFEYEI